MDEDSNSGLEARSSHLNPEDARKIPFARKRDLSFSDIQTPGGDGDTFLLNYK